MKPEIKRRISEDYVSTETFSDTLSLSVSLPETLKFHFHSAQLEHLQFFAALAPLSRRFAEQIPVILPTPGFLLLVLPTSLGFMSLSANSQTRQKVFVRNKKASAR